MIKSRLRCPSSPTDEINFPWKQTSKYFHTVLLIPFYSICSSYLDFLLKAFFLYIFFPEFFRLVRADLSISDSSLREAPFKIQSNVGRLSFNPQPQCLGELARRLSNYNAASRRCGAKHLRNSRCKYRF